jgi:CBS-domain-containing membrane protein
MPEFSEYQSAQRLRIYLSEGDHWHGRVLSEVILELARGQGMAGATMLRGVAGFGAHSHLHSTVLETLSMELPLVIELVDKPEKIGAFVERVSPLLGQGLITLEEVRIVKQARRAQPLLPAGRLVGEAMTREVFSIGPETPVHVAWQAMLKRRLKALPVVNWQGQVLGIVTDEDLIERAGIRQRLSVAVRLEAREVERELRTLEQSRRQVQEVMSKPVVTAAESEALEMAAGRMVKRGLKRLPVVDGEGKLVGMLSRLDVLRQAAHNAQPGPAGAPAAMPSMCTLGEVMTANIPMAFQDDDLGSLVEKFVQSGSHRLIVVDEQGKALGLISDSDVVARIQPEKRRSILEALRRLSQPAAGRETAFELMSPGVLSAGPEMAVREAVQLMLDNSRKWLVVVGPEGKPLGLVDRQILLETVCGPVE